MTNAFDISGDDVAQLKDDALRDLIGLLCEAECRANGISPNGVTWGGHQDATDGGLDVVVNNENALPSSFIPRKNVGFQVKKPDMPASLIKAEMNPRGAVREAIKTLIKEHGSYVIVSSSGSTSHSALQNRIKAMRVAISNESGHENLHLDFYDRGRIATWIRSHPSIILWVRDKVGRTLKGWMPHQNWSRPSEAKEEYLLDDNLRLYNGTSKLDDNHLPVLKGIALLRSALSVPGSCLRLVGLSGVGKTRLVQALFEESIGEGALNPNQAFYTDMSYSPDPEPRDFANQLISNKTRAILIVDNCPPDLHKRMKDVCAGSKSTISLITIEYDVREDLPEETKVFRLEPASDDLIIKLIKRRFSHISLFDASTIGMASGGNARIAIALASTLNQGETLAGLKDEELFERLFHQRNTQNSNLSESALALSLAYSFDGTNTGEGSELSVLAALIGKSANELYRHVSELINRDLIQSRSNWRAVLPHAVANRLAKRALETIPADQIVTGFMNCGSDRLFKSFTRRLNSLHDCKAAVQIATGWLEENGWLGNVENLNDLGISTFENIAPLCPGGALTAIERASKSELFFAQSVTYRSRFLKILRSLAFDQQYFIRSTSIICLFALGENHLDSRNSAVDILRALFLLRLSGTHANAETRFSLINELIRSSASDRQDLGFVLFASALEAWHFNSSYNFSFGARSRDDGYRPKTQNDVAAWYSYFIQKLLEIITNTVFAAKAKNILADKFRGLWTKAGMYSELISAAEKIKAKGLWIEGWVEVKKTIYFDSKRFNEETNQRLIELNKLLQPDDLAEEIDAFVFLNRPAIYYTETLQNGKSIPNKTWDLLQEKVVDLGVQAANDTTLLDTLINKIVSINSDRLWSFGKGLAIGCINQEQLWNKLRSQFQAQVNGERNITVLLAFLAEIDRSNKILCNKILDQILVDEFFIKWFIRLQLSVAVDAAGVERLNRYLDNNLGPIDDFIYLAYGRRHEHLKDKELADLLLKISAKEPANLISIEILNMKFHGTDAREHSPAIINAGRKILKEFKFSNDYNNNLDYNLSIIAEACLNDDNALEVAEEICLNVINSIQSDQTYFFHLKDFLSVVALKQPHPFLNSFVGNKNLDDYQLRRLFREDFDNEENPLNNIPAETILLWCAASPNTRYPLITALISPYFLKDDDQGNRHLEWKPLIHDILESANETEGILNILDEIFSPTSWSGSLSDVLKSRLPLAKELLSHSNSEISTWASNVYAILRLAIEGETQRENEVIRYRNESFE